MNDGGDDGRCSRVPLVATVAWLTGRSHRHLWGVFVCPFAKISVCFSLRVMAVRPAKSSHLHPASRGPKQKPFPPDATAGQADKGGFRAQGFFFEVKSNPGYSCK